MGIWHRLGLILVEYIVTVPACYLTLCVRKPVRDPPESQSFILARGLKASQSFPIQNAKNSSIVHSIAKTNGIYEG
jgi:hypothetical protein